MPKRTLIDEILAPGGITVAFQPMVSITGGRTRIFAVEALSRGPAGSNLERADVLFDYVRRKGREAEVDRMCVKNALREFATIPVTAAISLNVHAATIESDPTFTAFLIDTCLEVGVEPSSVILEIVEQQPFCNEQRFLKNIVALRQTGMRIALDDIGMGYSNFKMMVEIRPDYYKVDRAFVHGSHASDGLRATLRAIVGLANDLGGSVIAEGVEDEADLSVVLGAGVDLVQGYLICRPVSAADARTGISLNPGYGVTAMDSKQKGEMGK